MQVTVVKHPNYGAGRGVPGNTVISVYLDLECQWTPPHDLGYCGYTFRSAPGEWGTYVEQEKLAAVNYITETLFRGWQRKVERHYNEQGLLAPWQVRPANPNNAEVEAFLEAARQRAPRARPQAEVRENLAPAPPPVLPAELRVHIIDEIVDEEPPT